MNSPIRIATLSLSLLATACNRPAESTAPAAAPASAPVAPIPNSVVAAPAAPAVAPVASVAPVPAAPSAAVLASADGEIAGTRVEINELKRNSAGTVTLKFTMHNDSEQALHFSSRLFGDMTLGEDYSSVGGVHLLDPVGKKKYLVVRDSANQCLCSNNVPSITKSKVSLWAKFPSPPEDVKTVTVVIPHFPPLDDLAIR